MKRPDFEKYRALMGTGEMNAGDWDNCAMGVAVAPDIEGCIAAGWPKWAAELVTVIFDRGGDAREERGLRALEAFHSAAERGADFEAVYRAIRLNAILPIAMESIGDGDEPWRVECRAVVQDAIDCGGRLTEAQKGRASRAAWAAWAAWDAEAAGAAWAARAARAVGAAAAEAAAHTRIFEATIAALEEGQ